MDTDFQCKNGCKQFLLYTKKKTKKKSKLLYCKFMFLSGDDSIAQPKRVIIYLFMELGNTLFEYHSFYSIA